MDIGKKHCFLSLTFIFESLVLYMVTISVVLFGPLYVLNLELLVVH